MCVTLKKILLLLCVIHREKSKKWAEQVAAAVCIETLRSQPDAKDFICGYARSSSAASGDGLPDNFYSVLPQRRPLSNDLLAESHLNKKLKPQTCPSVDAVSNEDT